MKYSVAIASSLFTLSLGSVIKRGTIFDSPLVKRQSPNLQQIMLDAHNGYRQAHGVPPVTWSSDLAATAQAAADQCVFQHSDTSNGENVGAGSDSMNNPGYYVYLWYNEVQGYDYDNPTDDCNHFTQVVWKDSTQIGCGWKTGCTGVPNIDGPANLVFCQYLQAGNTEPPSDTYPSEVLAPTGTVPDPPSWYT